MKLVHLLVVLPLAILALGQMVFAVSAQSAGAFWLGLVSALLATIGYLVTRGMR